jgi:putative tryptophan/tyrosine transport system substrate-binding protein
MRDRREFITLLGGAAAWPVAGRAQQGERMRVIGVLTAGGPPSAPFVAGFGRGLAEMGFDEGRNLAIVTRSTEQYDSLPGLAAQLVGVPVAVIYAAGSANSVLVLKAASGAIPIVFANGSDPVRLGLVASMNRPGGNITGVTFISSTLTAKRLELLREIVPGSAPVALLTNPSNLRAESDIADVASAARSVGQEVVVIRASSQRDLEGAFVTMVQRQVGALLVGADALFNNRADQIIAMAARHRIPASYPQRSSTRKAA